MFEYDNARVCCCIFEYLEISKVYEFTNVVLRQEFAQVFTVASLQELIGNNKTQEPVFFEDFHAFFKEIDVEICHAMVRFIAFQKLLVRAKLLLSDVGWISNYDIKFACVEHFFEFVVPNEVFLIV